MNINSKEELCPEAKDYLEWYDRVALLHIKKFAAHLENCPRCLEWLSSTKDKLGLDLLKASDEDILSRSREITEG